MDMPKIPDFATPVDLALLAVLAVGVLIIAKKNFPDLIVDAGAGAVGVIGDAAGGVAIGVGDLVGIPRISDSECQRALRIGDAWAWPHTARLAPRCKPTSIRSIAATS